MSDGFLLVDKPAAMTSHDVIDRVRRVFGMRKVGHAGTLDPMATGLLVVGLGKATRLLRFIQDLPKEYVASLLFGVGTDSGDADGSVTEEVPVAFGQAELANVLEGFIGTIDQVPPQVSAIKRGGKRLHELARSGLEVKLEPRPVVVHELELVDAVLPQATLRVRCGKGTYIRVLADDIAIRLGSRAHLSALRRTGSGSHDVADAATLDTLEGHTDPASLVLGLADGLRDLTAVEVPDDQRRSARHGAPIRGVNAPPGSIRVLDGCDLIGVYVADGDMLIPEVVLG